MMNVLKQLVVIGCVFSACAKPPPYAKHAQDTAKAFSLIAEKESGLISLGSGGFYTEKKIDSIYIDFEIKKHLTRDNAKSLLQITVDTFVNYVNENEAIRPYLKSYPITAKQVSVSIALVDEKRMPVKGFSQIHLYEGTIYYSTFIPEKKEYSSYLEELHLIN